MKVEGYIQCKDKMPEHTSDVKVLWCTQRKCYGEGIGFYDKFNGFFNTEGDKFDYDTEPTHWKGI